MAEKTLNLRHAWRVLNDGDRDLKVLVLQQWHAADDDDPEEIFSAGGYWEDVEIDMSS